MGAREGRSVGHGEGKTMYGKEDKEDHRPQSERVDAYPETFFSRLATGMDWIAPKFVHFCDSLYLSIRHPLTDCVNSPLLTRISLSLGLLSLALFIYGNILLFTSVDTCRRSAPLLWWAVMVVIGVGWFLLLEVVFVVLVVGVVGPGILVSQSISLFFCSRYRRAHRWHSCGCFVGLVEEVWAGGAFA